MSTKLKKKNKRSIQKDSHPTKELQKEGTEKIEGNKFFF